MLSDRRGLSKSERASGQFAGSEAYKEMLKQPALDELLLLDEVLKAQRIDALLKAAGRRFPPTPREEGNG